MEGWPETNVKGGKMTRRDANLDALVRYLGARYYLALHGEGSAADVSKAVAKVAEAEGRSLELPTGAGEGAGTTGRTGQWQVGDVMTAKVVAVPEQTSYKQIAQLLHEHHLTALPVLSPEGRVAGMVSEADRSESRSVMPAARDTPAGS
jgi:CBS domain-containing protein